MARMTEADLDAAASAIEDAAYWDDALQRPLEVFDALRTECDGALRTLRALVAYLYRTRGMGRGPIAFACGLTAEGLDELLGEAVKTDPQP